jgi:hypothetical protein
MADFIMLVDTAIEVQVNLLSLLDDGDFKSRETTVAYDAAGMDLVWNFITVGGTVTQTAVTPTSGGNYDWAHVGDGIYKIEIPASGGASINNDTEGFGWFTGIVTGVLPWRGPVIQFSPANVVNSLVTGSDKLQVDTVELGSDTQSATDLKDFADAGYDPSTNKVQGVLLTDTVTTYTGNTPQTGDSFARIGATGSGLTSLATQASVNTIDGIVDDILLDTAEIGAAGAGLTNINLPNQAMDIVGNITGNISGSVGSVTGAVGSVTGLTAADVSAIKTQTDKFVFTVANNLNVNVQYVNDVEVTGTGATGDEWGP